MIVLFKSRIKGQLKKLPEHIKRRFWDLVEELKKNPLPLDRFDIVKLKGYEHTYRVRLGGYRVIYEIQVKRGVIVVHSVLPRERAYE